MTLDPWAQEQICFLLEPSTHLIRVELNIYIDLLFFLKLNYDDYRISKYFLRSNIMSAFKVCLNNCWLILLHKKNINLYKLNCLELNYNIYHIYNTKELIYTKTLD